MAASRVWSEKLCTVMKIDESDIKVAASDLQYDVSILL